MSRITHAPAFPYALAAPGDVLRYGSTTVTVGTAPRGGPLLQVLLPNGDTVEAVSQYRPEDLELAERLGYGKAGVDAMTLDHDRLHVLLCNALGLDESPALREALLDKATPLGRFEEAAVLAVQAWVNGLRAAGKLPRGFT